MTAYYPPYKSSSNNIKVELDLTNYAKKTVYNTKVTSIETQIAGLTKNTVDNLADITKLKAIDTNSFVTRTNFQHILML